MAFVDKKCIQQVLGCLLKNPQYLSEVDKYRLTTSDFPSRFERFIFGAIQGLYYNGAKKISAFDVENYLNTNETAAKTFSNNNGIEYLQDIEEYSNEENFPYYYNKLKKLNLLNDFQKQGIDVSDFYIEDLTDVHAMEVNQAFEDLTIQDIVAKIKKKIIKLENEYSKSDEVESWTAADEIDEIIDGFGSPDEIGLPVQGEIFNKIINGAERGALTIRSAPSGTFKTRQAVGDACLLAYPLRYDSSIEQWRLEGNCEKVLFIITEQKLSQLLKMIVAYLSDVNESKFKYGNFTKEETLRIAQAKAIIKHYGENFQIVRMPNPTIELAKTMIRENCLTHDIGYVFFDYIFINPMLLAEFRGFNIRNDEALLMFSTALKDLAIELNVSVFTSTQVNAKIEDNRDIKNEGVIAGSRSIINKADNACVCTRPTNEELEVLDKLSIKKPNLVTDIFKVRSGAWTQVRIWSYFDGGTMKKKDLFITDSRLEPIQDFFNEDEVNVISWEVQENQKDIEQLIDGFNEELRKLAKDELG